MNTVPTKNTFTAADAANSRIQVPADAVGQSLWRRTIPQIKYTQISRIISSCSNHKNNFEDRDLICVIRDKICEICGKQLFLCKSMQQSLERIYPDDPEASNIEGAETIQFHLERYRFASQHLKPGLVADIACGSGYGSRMLAGTGSRIIAVDSDPEAIQYAASHYPQASINFICANAMDFFWGTEFQTVVSLETIEHLPAPADFVKHMALQLAPGGRFIASAPVTPSMDANPYHLNDFSQKSFRKLFTDCGLKEISSILQVQPYKPFQLVKNKGSRKLRKNLLGYYLRNPSKIFLRLGSVLRDGFRNKYLIVVFEKPF